MGLGCHWTPAGLCSNPAVLTCLHCSQLFCDPCYAAHADRAHREVLAGTRRYRIGGRCRWPRDTSEAAWCGGMPHHGSGATPMTAHRPRDGAAIHGRARAAGGYPNRVGLTRALAGSPAW